jgi:hypothetical protein
MSGPIRFMILAIVIGIKNFRYVCFVRRLCSVQTIYTDPVDFYSQGVRCGIVRPTDLPEMISGLSEEFFCCVNGIKRRNASLVR